MKYPHFAEIAQRRVCYVCACAWSCLVNEMGLVAFLFPLVAYFFICLWCFLGLLRVLFIILRNPFTALKKTTRESKCVDTYMYVHVFSTPSLSGCSPASVPTGPQSGLTRVCDCQRDQVPLRLCWRHLQTTHAAPPRLPRGQLHLTLLTYHNPHYFR